MIRNLPRWTPITGSLITVFIALLIITPVLINQLVPLHDYPHHLARIIILSDLDQPVYKQFYRQGSFLLPNMAMEMIAVPLAHFVGAVTASRLFVMLSLLSMLFGTMMLHRAAHGRFSPWPLLAVVFLFNCIFRFGFLNYIFGMGIALFAAGLWLLMKPGIFRFIFSLLASIVLILLHFSAFGIFALIVTSIQIHTTVIRWQHDKSKLSAILQLGLSASPFFITTALFLLLSPTAEIIDKNFSYPDYLGAKPFGAIYSILTSLNWLNIVSLSSITIVLCLLFFSKRLKFSPPLILAFLAMLTALAALPSSMMGNVFVDVRLAPALAFLAIAAIDIKENNLNTDRLIACLALALSLLTSIGISYQWRDFNKEILNNINVLSRTEPGATIFSASSLPDPKLITDTADRRIAWNPSLKHIASYAVLYGPKFVPMTFADPKMQPLNIADKYQVIKDFQGDNPRKTLNGLQLEKFLFEIKQNLENGSWPKLDNVYVHVVGFNRIKKDFNIKNTNDWKNITDIKNDYILIKLK